VLEAVIVALAFPVISVLLLPLLSSVACWVCPTTLGSGSSTLDVSVLEVSCV
jgi:hypothetical protein